MENILIMSEVVISILLIIFILAQNKDGGLGSAFGGGGSFQSTKRGPEKFLYNATIILGAAFMINAVLIVVL